MKEYTLICKACGSSIKISIKRNDHDCFAESIGHSHIEKWSYVHIDEDEMLSGCCPKCRCWKIYHKQQDGVWR